MFPCLLLSCVIIPFALTTGLRLSGPCPVVPPSHNRDAKEIYQSPEIILSVAFTSDNPSYLFRKLVLTDPAPFWNFQMVKKMDDTGLQKLKIFLSSSEQQGNTVGIWMDENIRINSTVFDHITGKGSVCHSPIEESIWVWWKFGMCLIWSCRNLTGTHDHDEAAIFVTFPDRGENYTKLIEIRRKSEKELMSLLRITWSDYVSDNFFDHTNWTVRYPVGSDHQFPCNIDKKSIDIFFLITASTIASMMVVIICIVWWIT